MSQPVVGTPELCDALRKTGMEHEQAEGVARALGKELGEHVVTQGDLQVGFEQVRGEIQAARAETQAAFEQAFLALVTGAGFFRTAAPGPWDSARAPAVPAPPSASAAPAPAP